MKNTIYEKMMEEISNTPDEFVDKVLRLAQVARRLSEAYPLYRDDPSDEERLCWMELESATNSILYNTKISNDDEHPNGKTTL